MSDEEEGERDLAGRQPTALYPIGRALRSTFHADNHDSLGDDLTGLMLHLARVDDEPIPPSPLPAIPPATRAPPAPAPPASPGRSSAPSWLDRLLSRLSGR